MIFGNNMLGIKAPPKKANDFSETLFSEVARPQGNGMAVYAYRPESWMKALRIVKDPYSGNNLGEAPVTDFTKRFENQIKALQSQLTFFNNPKNNFYRDPNGSQSNSWYGFTNGTYLTPTVRNNYITNATDQLTKEQARFSEFTNSGYQQKDNQFFRSYDMYTNDWNESFRAGYMNPRITAESQSRNARARQQNEAQASLNNGMQSLAIGSTTPNSRRTAKSTGLGASSSSSMNFTGMGGTGLGI